MNKAEIDRHLCAACYEEVDKVCKICDGQIMVEELRWGTGLCDKCFDSCIKTCRICGAGLRYDQLRWRTGLCDPCYDKAPKHCCICNNRLEADQLHWRTGMCDGCYDNCDNKCKLCRMRLEPEQLSWGTGLCDECYDGCEKKCHLCHHHLPRSDLHWRSGLCNQCYDKCEKVCFGCNEKIHLLELHWRSGLCNKCYDDSEKLCRRCLQQIGLDQLHWLSKLCDTCYNSCDKDCMFCGNEIGIKELHWGTGICDTCYSSKCRRCGVDMEHGQAENWPTGLCDACYDALEKKCKKCGDRLALGTLRYGTNLCDRCYDNCDKLCQKCKRKLPLGYKYWAHGLCNPCYTTSFPTRPCWQCSKPMEFGVPRWGTGLCEQCSAKPLPGRKKVGVSAVIFAQLVYYMAPALVQPSLYLHIAQITGEGSAAGSFAAVLFTASVVLMVAPVPLAYWAERYGERAAYVGITSLAAAGSLLLVAPSRVAVAVGWGAISAPPSIRGVRTVLFAKNVPPEDLSRFGQYATAAGLAGAIVGPLISSVVSRIAKSTELCSGFTLNAFLAFLTHALCATSLYQKLPGAPPRRRVSHDLGQMTSGFSERRESCEKCRAKLTADEQRYRLALCNKCYDDYTGEGIGWKRFKRRVLFQFAAIAFLLEFSMNMAVIATFQPIVVNHFAWKSSTIAVVNSCSAGVSIIVSILSAMCNCNEKFQACLGGALYCVGVLLFTLPPIQQWSSILGLVLGLKAQILFAAPFTAIFSRIIGRTRLTNRLTVSLCLAPAVGGAVGTFAAPFGLGLAGSPFFMLLAMPAVVAFLMISCYVYTMNKEF